MKRRLLIVLALCMTLFVCTIPLFAQSEFVFEDVPVEALDATSSPAPVSSATPTPAASLSPSPTQTDNDSAFGSFFADDSVGFVEVPLDENAINIPTRAPILNDTWPKQIVITVGGDCTIGNTVAQEESPLGFKTVVSREGLAWPFSGIVDVLSQDDLTIVNCEGTFTDNQERVDKLYNFKGPTEYAKIFTYGSVEAVTLANNHAMDYGSQGKEDTMTALDEQGIVYFFEKQTAIYEVRGVKIGLIGNSFPYKNEQRDISGDVKELRNAGCQIVLAVFHWGSEGEYKFTREQRKIGRAAIKAGADAVIGHHPHVIQGIEAYEDSYILYSLANLVFGGNVDPKDKDTYLAQFTFTVNEDGSLEGKPELKLIPAQLTQQTKGTDYKPVLVTDEKEHQRIMKKILSNSYNMDSFVNP